MRQPTRVAAKRMGSNRAQRVLITRRSPVEPIVLRDQSSAFLIRWPAETTQENPPTPDPRTKTPFCSWGTRTLALRSCNEPKLRRFSSPTVSARRSADFNTSFGHHERSSPPSPPSISNRCNNFQNLFLQPDLRSRGGCYRCSAILSCGKKKSFCSRRRSIFQARAVHLVIPRNIGF